MSTLTIILIILFFVVLLCKPTYAFVHRPKEHKVLGVIAPLGIVLLIKCLNEDKVEITNRQFFEAGYNYIMEKRSREE